MKYQKQQQQQQKNKTKILETNGNDFSPWGTVFLTGPYWRGFVFSQVQGPGPCPVFRRYCFFKTFLKILEQVGSILVS